MEMGHWESKGTPLMFAVGATSKSSHITIISGEEQWKKWKWNELKLEISSNFKLYQVAGAGKVFTVWFPFVTMVPISMSSRRSCRSHCKKKFSNY